jgi:transposase
MFWFTVGHSGLLTYIREPYMIRLHFSDEDIKVLQHERYYYPDPKVQRRMEILLLKAHGLPHHQIQKISGACGNTVRNCFRLYREGGIEKVKEVNYYRPQSELSHHESTLKEHFDKHPVASVQQGIAKIEELTGIRRAPTQARKFLRSIGMRLLKVGTIPSKADPDEQKAFKKDKLDPRIKEAKEGKRVLLFVDAAHFVFHAYPGFLWCFARVFIKAPSGRKRFNVLGALNATTHQLTTVVNETYINAQSVCELLRQIADQHVGIPITLVLDNAKYQKCALVQDLAKSLDIELLYLPAYSPNLNLIERLWKFVKKECLYSKYYPTFAEFKAAICDCLNSTHTKHKQSLKSLLTLRFQVFEKAQIMAA